MGRVDSIGVQPSGQFSALLDLGAIKPIHKNKRKVTHFLSIFQPLNFQKAMSSLIWFTKLNVCLQSWLFPIYRTSDFLLYFFAFSLLIFNLIPATSSRLNIKSSNSNKYYNIKFSHSFSHEHIFSYQHLSWNENEISFSTFIDII